MAKKFQFSAWVYPTIKEITPDDVDSWAELGLTVPMSASMSGSDEDLVELKKYLDKAFENGIQLIANVGSTSYWALGSMGEEKYEENFRRIYEQVKGHPGLYGFYCGDEPNSKDALENTIKALKIQKKVAPELNPWINLRGSTMDDSREKLGGRTFTEWLKYFKDETGVDYYTWDEYSQMINDGGFRVYLHSLKTHAEAAEAAGVDWWLTSLASGHWCFRVPTEYEFMLEITTAAAAGAKGISWFRLYDRAVGPECYGSPIDEFGYKTEQYWMLMRCQRRFMAQFGEIMPTLKRKSTYLIGFQYGSFPIFSNKCHDIIKEIRSFENGMLSFFEDAEGNEYCALVNTERKQPADYRFVYDSTKASLTEYRLNGKVKMPFNGSSDPNSESMGLILYPGQMMLFRIDRK